MCVVGRRILTWASEGEKRESPRSTDALTLGAKGLNPPVPLILLCLVRAVVVVVVVVHVCLWVGWVGGRGHVRLCEKERSMVARLLRRRAQALLGEGMGLRAAATAVQRWFCTHRGGLDGLCVAWR